MRDDIEGLSKELDRWRKFATNLWLEAQSMAESIGDEEELFESFGYVAQDLGLTCSYTPEDEDEDDEDDDDDDDDDLEEDDDDDDDDELEEDEDGK